MDQSDGTTYAGEAMTDRLYTQSELDAAVAERSRNEQALIAKIIEAVHHLRLSHQHWDKTGQSGAGCELCHDQHAWKDALSLLLQESPMNAFENAVAERERAAAAAAYACDNMGAQHIGMTGSAIRQLTPADAHSALDRLLEAEYKRGLADGARSAKQTD